MSQGQFDNVQDVYPLLPIQQGMLFHCIEGSIPGVFVSQFACTLSGNVDQETLRKVWLQTARRHDALRSMFVWDGLDEPLQVVRGSVEPVWQVEDWRDLSPEQQQQRLQHQLQQERRQGFDLAQPPLIRFSLSRLADQRWRWQWTFHHLSLDGWSVQVLLREVLAALAGDAAAPPVFRYRDFVAWQQEQAGAGAGSAAEAFWRAELRGFSEPTRIDLTTDQDAGGDVPGAADHPLPRRQRRHRLSSELSSAVKRFAAGQRVTLGTVIHAAWALLLGRYCGVGTDVDADDVVFGSTVSGRSAALPGIDHAVGCFINTLPCRVAIDRSRSVGDWLGSLQQQLLELRQWESVSLASIQRWSELPAGQALFETIVVVENYPGNAASAAVGSGVELGEPEYLEYSNYPLALLFVPGEQFECIAVHDPNRYPDASVARILSHLEMLLEAFAGAPDRPLSSLPDLPAAELDRVLNDWNRGAMERSPEPCIHQLFEARVADSPDAIAVTDDGQSLSYRELDRRANRLALHLQSLGLGTDARVGIMLPRSIALPVAIFGVLGAGAAYVPLDPEYPAGRLAQIVDEAGIAVVVTAGACLDSVPDRITTVVLVEQFSDGAVNDARADAATGGDALAYVMFTSGSAARPKGVMVPHSALVHSTVARFEVYQGGPRRFLLLPSFAFDSSVAGIFWTLCGGGNLVLPPPGAERDLDRLAAVILDHRITHLLCLPTLYRLLLAQLPEQAAGHLECVIVAGEACPAGLADAHYRRLPRTALYNEYGPTEATVWSTVQRLQPSDAGNSPPIGRPIPNMRAYLLDRQRRAVPIGVTGELYLAGDGLARGYLDRPELTAECFPEVTLGALHPQRMYRSGDLARYREDGRLVFAGRADAQLKIRGYRIEPAEVEQAIATCPGVVECAVAALSEAIEGDASRDADPAGNRQRLAAWLVLDGWQSSRPAHEVRNELREALVTVLPEYMVPDRWEALAALPRLPNGKLDQQALADAESLWDAADEQQGGLVAPRNEVERTLAGIWAGLLGFDQIGVHDNFFELGGDSIVTIQMVSQCRQAGLRIEPQHIARWPTIAELAAAVAPEPPDAPDVPDATGEANGDVPLAPIQHWFFELALSAPQHWNHSRLFELPPDIDADRLSDALATCVSHHDLLRASFEHRDGRWRQSVAPVADFELPLQVVDIDDPCGCSQQTIDGLLAEVESGLSLSGGRLIGALLIRCNGQRPPLLLVATHHLLTDVVSWNTLADDLQTAYRQRQAGASPSLPPKTASARAWVDALAEHADSAAGRAELGFWQQVAGGDAAALPVDLAVATEAVEADARSISVALDAERTRALLQDAHAAYNTRPHDLLVTALTQTLCAWAGASSLRLGLEGHGRDYLEQAGDGGPDVARTVGWFTAYYPLDLQLPDAAEGPGAAVRSIKDQLRAVPGGGQGYGALRYLSADAGVRESLAAATAPQVLFNYLGRAVEAPRDALLRPVTMACPTARDPGNARPHLLEVNAAVEHGRLVASWTYVDGVHRRATIERLAGDFIEGLDRLLDHCLNSQRVGFTPSDFPDADLGQDDLDRLLDGIE